MQQQKGQFLRFGRDLAGGHAQVKTMAAVQPLSSVAESVPSRGGESRRSTWSPRVDTTPAAWHRENSHGAEERSVDLQHRGEWVSMSCSVLSLSLTVEERGALGVNDGEKRNEGKRVRLTGQPSENALFGDSRVTAKSDRMSTAGFHVIGSRAQGTGVVGWTRDERQRWSDSLSRHSPS